jgi:hypothetical protein
VLPEGGFLATAEIRAYQPGDTGLFENTQAVMRWSANGAFVDTIAIIPGRQLRLRRGMAPDEGFDRPRLSIAGVGSGFVAGNRSSAEFVEYRADGTVGRRMVVPDPPMQFTPAFAVKWNEALLRAVPPVLRENVLAYTRSGRIAWEPVFPYYGAHMAATDGRLWVQDGFRGDFDPRYWLVYRNGVLEARVSLPDDFTILEAGNDWVLGFTSDRLDVQTVRMHRLVSVASPQPYRQPMRPLLADRCTFSRY